MAQSSLETNSLSCLVTRPKHQADNLKQLLIQQGFKVLCFPTIDIIPASKSACLSNLDSHLAEWDIALFVSRNAVDFTFNHIKLPLPSSLQLGVIGKGSLLALNEHGVSTHIIPAENYNSEGLLESSVLLNVRAKRIVIFRGQEGRNLLGDTLRERGAKVEYIEVYQRIAPEYAAGHFAELTQQHSPDVAIFTSAEGLHNAFKLLSPDEAKMLRSKAWLLISERMRETACDLGHNADIIIASSASDEGILQALKQWHQSITQKLL